MNTTAHTEPEVSKEKKGRWRMSGLLGKNKDHDRIIEEETTTLPTTTTADRPDLKTTESANRDSAYGSSSNHTNSSLGLPTISKDQAAEQDGPVKIQMDKGTGRRVVCVTTTTKTEVFDADTGAPAEVPAGKDVVVRKAETDLSPAAPQDVGATRVNESTTAPAIPVKAPKRNSLDGDRRPRMSDLERTTSPSVREDYEPIGSNIVPSRSQNNLNNTNFSRPHSSLAHPHEGVNNGGYVPPHQQAQHPGYNSTSATGYNNAPNSSGYNNAGPGHNNGTGYNAAPGHHNGSTYNNGTGYNNGPGYNNGSAYNNEQPGLARGANTGEPIDRITSPYSGSVKRRPVPGADGQPVERMGTMASLKAAAAGIHGAGETLRGAINSKVEQRTGGTAEQIAAHDAVTQRGLSEIETGKFAHSNRNSANAHELHNNSVVGGAGHVNHGSVPITGGNSIPAASAHETEGYAPSPLVTQAQEGYQDNVPYLPDPLGEAPPNMASSLGYANPSGHASSQQQQRPSYSPFPHVPSSSAYNHQQQQQQHHTHGGRFMEADDSPVSPIDEHGYSGDSSNVGTMGTATPGSAPLYGEQPAKKGRVRNLLRKKSVRT